MGRPICVQAMISTVVAASLLAPSSACRPSGELDPATTTDFPSSTASPRSSAEPLVVSAAASTKEVIEELASQFGQEQGVQIHVNLGGSNALATQIIQGAPVDVFLSASTEWVNAVANAGLVDEQIVLLENSLVMVTPKGNPAGILRPEDLIGERVTHVALAGETVPAGKYANQTLRALQLLELLTMNQKIVRGQDVRVVLSYIERGEADAGIVYATDARASGQVDVVHVFDPSTHDPIHYGLAKIKREELHRATDDFYRFLISSRASEVLERRGFRRPAVSNPKPAEHP